jgi:hypothetical protein
MHLLTFMEMRNPGWFFRTSVVVAQMTMFNMFFFAYLVSPKFCHALVGYLEEEAVKTYTHALAVSGRGHGHNVCLSLQPRETRDRGSKLC